MNTRPVLVLASLSVVLAVACGGEKSPPAKLDAGSVRSPDAAPDARPPDAAVPDTAGPDRPGPDAVPADAPAPVGAADASSDAVAADPAPADAAAPDGGPAPDAGAPDAVPSCAGNVSRAMLCSTYCSFIAQVCVGANAQFASPAACDSACNGEAWACGNVGDSTGNSLFCRLLHLSRAGLGSPATECPNAGPNSPTCR